jgi:hypothetical protein
MRDGEPDDVYRLELVDQAKSAIKAAVNSSVKKGFISPEQGASAVNAYDGAIDALTKLIQKEKHEEDRDFFILTLVGLSFTSFIIGGQSPGFVSRIEKLRLRQKAANSRKIKSARSLSRELVDEIICACFDDKEITKISHSNRQKAGHALAHVNELLADKGQVLGREAPQYKDADSLRRRYEAIAARIAS